MERLRGDINSNISIKDDIKNHLEEILNTKRGSALIRENYGMDNRLINEEEDLKTIRQSLIDLIEEFEPRIKVETIIINIEENIDDKEEKKKEKEIFLSREFKIIARVESKRISFESTLNSFPAVTDDTSSDNCYKKWEMKECL